jgi:single-strand DNA-binding protein
MSLAKVNGLFRLTRDIEVQYTAGGTAVGKLGLACSEKYKEKETQLFLDATAFGKVVDILAQYAGTKGTQIYLSGKLQTDSWDDKNTGKKQYKTTMVIEGFDFVSGQQPQNNQQPQQQHMQQNGQPMTPQQVQNQQVGNFQQPAYAPNDFKEDDVPF